MRLTYKNANTGDSTVKYVSSTPAGMYANGYIIPNHESISYPSGSVVGMDISRGNIDISLQTLTQQVETTAFAAYGYNTITATPSISAGSDGTVTVGFSFSKKVDVLKPTRIYYP